MGYIAVLPVLRTCLQQSYLFVRWTLLIVQSTADLLSPHETGPTWTFSRRKKQTLQLRKLEGASCNQRNRHYQSSRTNSIWCLVNSPSFPQATPLQNPISIRHLSAFFTRSMWNKTQSFTSLLSRIVTNRSTALSSTAYVQILILRLGHPCQILLQSKHAGIPLNRIEFPKYKYEHIHLFIRLRVHIYMYVCMHARMHVYAPD